MWRQLLVFVTHFVCLTKDYLLRSLKYNLNQDLPPPPFNILAFITTCHKYTVY